MVISDSTGDTAERIVRAALLQFSDVRAHVRTYSRVRLDAEVEKIVERAAELNALLVFTVVNKEERDLLWQLVAPCGCVGIQKQAILVPVVEV